MYLVGGKPKKKHAKTSCNTPKHIERTFLIIISSIFVIKEWIRFVPKEHMSETEPTQRLILKGLVMIPISGSVSDQRRSSKAT